MNTFDHDEVDRTVLIGMRDGTQATLEDALAAKRRFGIRINSDTHTTAAAAAATLTAVTTAVRIAGVVLVALPDPDAVITTGPYRGTTYRDATIAAGASVVDQETSKPAQVDQWVELRIGEPDHEFIGTASAILHVSWNQWQARVRTVNSSSAGSNVLAAITAAALAVHEAFGIFKNTPGRDDGYRDLTIDLWAPGDPTTDTAPELAWAPAKWWLIGLGHLGQANAWVLAWLLDGHPEAEIVLQDDATISAANHSTGVFATPTDVGLRKTRLAARHLERAGLRTRIIEQRFDAANPPPQGQRQHVAVFGVDRVDVRRTISRAGFDLALDAGLGTDHDTFDSILIHRFPGHTTSSDVASWQTAAAPAAIPGTPAFDDLRGRYDICGITELAGTAVGAAFVGVIAAALTITEALRNTHEGAAHSPLRLDLASGRITAAPVAAPEPPAVRIAP